MEEITRSERRRLNLGDLMVLVAAVAAGIGLSRYANVPAARSTRMVRNASYFQSVRSGLGYASPVLIAATAACAVIRLRGPRPALVQLSELPGTMAVASASMVLLFGYLWMFVQRAVDTHPGFVLDPAQVNHVVYPGWAVAGAWLMPALGGRWRSDRSWVDRLGIGLGFAWLGLLLVWYGSWGLLR